MYPGLHPFKFCIANFLHFKGPFMTYKLCLGGENEGKLNLAAVQIYHKRRPILDFNVEIDPEHNHVLNINLNWDERNVRQAVVINLY